MSTAADDNKRMLRERVRRSATSLNCDGAYGFALAVTLVLALLIETAGDPGRFLLRYDRIPLAAGQWWRLFTAHVVHLDLLHTSLNALGIVLMWALFARDYTPLRWIAILLAAALGIDAGLWWLAPDVTWYVGASGVLHGVLAAGTLAHLRRGDLDAWILVAFMVGKLAYEQWTGALPFSATGVVVAAHLYGAIGGLAAALALRSRREPL